MAGHTNIQIDGLMNGWTDDWMHQNEAVNEQVSK